MIREGNLCENQNINIIQELGSFQVLEHQKDLSVSHLNSVEEYFAAKMNVKKRQLLLTLNGDSYTVQAGAMQWMGGGVNMNSGVKGVGNFFGKMVSSAVTGESVAKPEYTGYGKLMLEPTYRHILLLDVAEWGSIVLDDGLFLACQSSLEHKVVARSNVSSAILGGEGLFNLSLRGNGIVALESPVPMDELITVSLQDDCLKIDGNMAIAWSGSLDFTVEKFSKSLLGSAVSKEGFVNVYRGTGKVLMAPTEKEKANAGKESDSKNSPSDSKSDKAGKALDAVGNILDLFK